MRPRLAPQAPRLCVITGPTHGIGRVTAQHMARSGYQLALLCRNKELGDALAEELGDARVFECDLGDFASVRSACDGVAAAYPSIDVLINNAGFIDLQSRRLYDLDAMMVVNHLGPFLLTNLLMPLVRGRIVNVASTAHRSAVLTQDDPLGRSATSNGYGRSKLANVLFTFALARRASVPCNALHPGVVGTNIIANAGSWMKWFAPLAKLFLLSEEEGARTTIYLATEAAVADVSGAYFDQHQKRVEPSKLAMDVELQESLWRASEAAVAEYL